jgi:hypothetical protein
VPAPQRNSKTLLSTGGGAAPRWRHDGREICYVAGNTTLMVAAEVNGAGPSFQVGTVRTLFKMTPGGPRYAYDVSPDGQRFLVNTMVDQNTSVAPITVVVNWPATMRKQASNETDTAPASTEYSPSPIVRANVVNEPARTERGS